MVFYLHALSNETLQLSIVCFKSFLILLRFSVSSVFDMKTDISPLVCLFWERCEAEARLMATVCCCFQSDEKPPPGSQLLVTQQVSLICYIVLFGSLKTGSHVVDFLSSGCHTGSTCSIQTSPEKPPPSRPKAVGLMCLWAALLM